MAESIADNYPLLKIDDIYDEVVVRVFDLMKYTFGSIGLVLSIFVMFVITTQSPPQMKKVKYYLLGYSCCNLALDLIAVLYGPLGFSSFMVMYPRGLLSPMSATTSKFFLSAMLISLAGFGSFFLAMFIDRYFALTNHFLGKTNFHQNPIFYFIFICFLWCLFACCVFYAVFFSDFILPSEITHQILQQFLQYSEDLLNHQPSLLAVNLKALSKTLFILAPFGIGYVTILLIFLTLTFKNMNRAIEKLSTKSRTHHLMVFKCILFQSLTLFFMVICPFFGLIVCCVMKIEGLRMHLPFLIMWFFPIVDSLVTIMTIKPYRMFIFKFVKKSVQKMPNTSIHTQNQLFSYIHVS